VGFSSGLPAFHNNFTIYRHSVTIKLSASETLSTQSSNLNCKTNEEGEGNSKGRTHSPFAFDLCVAAIGGCMKEVWKVDFKASERRRS
jgi:hypothetical protein